ncbi:spindle pole body-associated protein sad1 [Aspergillus udagawae]|uniref:Spindle pole body-associated protein sad1 n=1 Tax=Aspergillus udagawae TaxID=91492 RepID=A0ABQ1A1Q7_9EURO|nr:spindle pole body-associated protein sad1 [Aspergillus udagawae]GFF71279.1 spindle pole body-associated protein sad1 [Aspergillus udagawae]GFG22115.1 spindle pole body-associated protein sad1 [Aspergillus udagawae]
MPPKRAGTRRAGATARSEASIIFGHSSPSVSNQPLPDVPTQPSWAYGSPAAPVLPRRLVAKKMDLAEVAESIDQTIRDAQKRDRQNDPGESNDADGRPHMNTRSRRRSTAANASPVRRRTKREPTPDQVQLLDALRDATVSPNQRNGDNEAQAERSTATPTPPIPHTLSTMSSPASQILTDPKYPSLPIEQLYPSPLQRIGSPTRNDVSLEMSQNAGIDDNESVISWMVERDIHDDDLQRTRSTRYRNEPVGKNITAPPRRFSGLAFANETIVEEDEPDSRLSVSKTPREPTVESETQSDHQTEQDQPLEPQKEPVPQVEVSSAPVRTIIPNFFTKEQSFNNSTVLSSDQSFTDHARSTPATSFIPRVSVSLPWRQILQLAGAILLTALSLLTIYSFSDRLASIPHDIALHFPFRNPAPSIPLNTSDLKALNSLNNQVIKLGAQVSSISKELRVVKSEVKNVASPTAIIEPVKVPKKPNFLSIGTGVLVDPRMTSPTYGEKRSRLPKWLQDQVSDLGTDARPKPNPPLTALVPWDSVGDCWCSAPRDGVSQLGLHLSRPIVPEEVVVEHIPKHATLNPGAAPKEMELWARYTINKSTSSDLPTEAGSAGWYKSYLNWLLSFESKVLETEYQSPMLSERFSLHDYIMGYLRPAYHNEPESAYWNATTLGPTFYRVGKWKYDLHGQHHIQEFSLDAIIDQPDIRVDRIAFRVNSNWGANFTCFYRLKLYGHL